MPEASQPAGSPRAALALAIVAVSTGALFVRLADAPPLVVAFYRCAFATVVLGLVGARACSREWPGLTRGERWMVLATGLGLALHFASWISSLSYTTVASSIVIVNTTPLWVALLTPMLSSDRLRAGTLTGIAASIGGCAIIGRGDFELSGDALFGDGLALVGAITAALYMLAGRRLRRKLSLLAYVVACYGSAAVFLLAFVLVSGESLVGYDAPTFGWMLALALVPQVIGHSSYNYALRYVSAALTSLMGLGETLGATLLAWAFLGERVGPLTVLGGLLVIVGVMLALRAERPRAEH